MSNNFFSPTLKISGGALLASFNSKTGSVFLKCLKQVANNQNKVGNFDGKNPIFIKLGQDEASDFIRAINERGESKFYHSFEENVSTGSLRYYEVDSKDKTGNSTKKRGYGLTVKSGEKEVKVGFTLASGYRFSLWLQNALNHIFDYEHVEEMKEKEEYNKKKAAAEKPKSEKTKKKEEYLPSEEEKQPATQKESDPFEDIDKETEAQDEF